MPERRLDALILVYDADRGVLAALVDVVKKAVGREECALCEITHGPLGKRGAWRACEARLGPEIAVEALHRDELPAAWGLARDQLPCVLGRRGSEPPVVVVPRARIEAMRGDAGALEAALREVLAAVPPSLPEQGPVNGQVTQGRPAPASD